MIKLYAPKSDVELVLIQSVLGSENIPYFIFNDHFGSLKPGPVIWLYNFKTIMVDEKDLERAAELITDYLQHVELPAIKSESEYSFFDKVRMVIEFLLFGWFIPGKMKRKNQLDK
jgi:hypothetical protein